MLGHDAAGTAALREAVAGTSTTAELASAKKLLSAVTQRAGQLYTSLDDKKDVVQCCSILRIFVPPGQGLKKNPDSFSQEMLRKEGFLVSTHAFAKVFFTLLFTFVTNKLGALLPKPNLLGVQQDQQSTLLQQNLQ